MSISPLQKARYAYEPKLPKILQSDIGNVAIKEGPATQSVADQEKVKALFPNTYGMKEISFVNAPSSAKACRQVVGVILACNNESNGPLLSHPA